jgi:cellulose synthase/poly-beta-1,6-N-acetylglucosamine synthase-like glycosyltransferase
MRRLIPAVTVITPAYNASATILETVQSALAQTCADIEVIVVDDGSPEPIAATLVGVNDERLRILRTERNQGVSGARNHALGLARAPLIAQLDADDLWRPDHLEGMLPAFDDAQVALAYSNVEVIGSPVHDRAIALRTQGDGLPDWISDRRQHPVNDLATLYGVNPIPAPSVVMRTAAVLAVGGYPRWLSVGEEYYLYIKLRRHGWRFAYVDRMSAVYRWPEPGRGVSFDGRRGARENFKLFAALTLRSPGDRAIRARAGAEFANVVSTHVPGSVPIARRVKRLVRGGGSDWGPAR